ncbi:histidine phosphatase family protein [Nocardia sp. 004]|uniref:histidine phosphatase family protein n=1 Tax=Nocardia sp. 004 TaxID=3385978 RepID=UPI0039A1613B
MASITSGDELGPDGRLHMPSPVPNVVNGIAPTYSIADLRVVRHGQSAANVAFADPTTAAMPLPGRDADIGLSARGHEQAVALGKWLAGLDEFERPQLVVCSPYLRAQQTWTVMARTAESSNAGAGCMRTVIDERVRDREMGVFELYPPTAIQSSAPEEARRRAQIGDWYYRPPGGESLADLCLRVRDVLNELDRTAETSRVLIISHDAVAAATRHVLAGIGAPPPTDLAAVTNGSISRWQSNRQHLHVMQWSDTSHLQEVMP